MRSKVVSILALALALTGAGMAMGQQNLQRGEEKLPTKGTKPRVEEETDLLGPDHPAVKEKTHQKKSKLEEVLAEALKNNADIRVAAAKLAEAEAELNRTRVQVTQQVAMLHHAIVSQKATVEFEQKKYDRMRTLQARQAIENTLVDEELAKLTAAKAKLAELEVQMPALLGRTAQAGYSLTIAEAKLIRQEAIRSSIKMERAQIEEAEGKIAHRVAGPMAEKIRKALSRTISVDFKNRPIFDVMDSLSKDSGLVIKLGLEYAAPEKLTVRCENLPFGTVLQLLEDSLPYGTIVVRDYGLLITHRQCVPPGAISVQEFLRQKPTEK